MKTQAEMDADLKAYFDEISGYCVSEEECHLYKNKLVEYYSILAQMKMDIDRREREREKNAPHSKS